LGIAAASAGAYGTFLQTTTPTLVTQFLQAGCSSWCPTSSVEALKVKEPGED